jgi:hypothetical protein
VISAVDTINTMTRGILWRVPQLAKELLLLRNKGVHYPVFEAFVV